MFGRVLGTIGWRRRNSGLRLAGHAHDDVVRLVREALRAGRVRRHGPQVLVVVERGRVVDVVAGVRPGLDVEQLLGHPQVRPEVGRHRVERLEQGREDPLVRPDDRVGRVGDVERHLAGVGVHDDLDAVADVVERRVAQSGSRRQRGRIEPLGVREPVARRVGILDVDQPAVVGHDQVGVLVEAQERRDPRQPIGQRPMEQELAVGGHLVADEQVEVLEAQGEEEARERRVELDPGGAGPAGGLARRRRCSRSRSCRPGSRTRSAGPRSRIQSLGRSPK